MVKHDHPVEVAVETVSQTLEMLKLHALLVVEVAFLVLASCVFCVGLEPTLLGRLGVISMNLSPLNLTLLDDPVKGLRPIKLLLLDPAPISVAQLRLRFLLALLIVIGLFLAVTLCDTPSLSLALFNRLHLIED